MSRGKVWQYPDFVRLFHTSTPLRSVELCKEWRGVRATRRKVGHYSHFVRLFTTASAPPHPLRSVELSKEGKNSGFHGQGWTWLSLKVLTVSFPDIFSLWKFEKIAWLTQTGIRRKRPISRALTIHGKSGNSGENANGTVHTGGHFPPKKSNTSRGITFFTFLPKRPKFLVPFVWLTSARLHLEEEGEKWRSFPRRVTAFCIWYNFNPFLFSETFSSLETFVGHFLPKFPWKW